MRDRKIAFLLMVVCGAIFIVGYIFPEPKSELPFLWVMSLIVLPMLGYGLWSMSVLREKSPHIIGPGFSASLLQLEPVDSCFTKDPKTGKTYKWLLFLHGGIKLFGYQGGGVLGCSVVREDLIMYMKGSQSAVIVWSIGKPFLMDARPGDPSHDLTGLDLEIYKMLQRHNFHPAGHVMLWQNPIDDPERQTKKMEQMDFEHQCELKNSEILKLSETIKNLTDKLTKISETKDSVNRSFGRGGWPLPRERQRDNREQDGGEGGWQ